jgi:hypothetical protein
MALVAAASSQELMVSATDLSLSPLTFIKPGGAMGVREATGQQRGGEEVAAA